VTFAENGPRSLIWWEWVGDHLDLISERLQEHIYLTIVSVVLGIIMSAPLAVAATRWRRLYAPLLVTGAVLYTIPSLAAFVLLLPWIKDRRTLALVVLTSYTILILVRNMVTGLDGVPADVREAASGMGYSRIRQLVQVELPIALPAIVAGIRIATVTTVGLVTVAALIGQGGLGDLILDGLRRDFPTPLMIGATLSVALAVLLDLVLLATQWFLTPWARAKVRA